MKSPKFLFVILSIFILAGCSSGLRSKSEPQSATTSGYLDANNKSLAREETKAPAQISLAQADQPQSIAEAMNRKIIRDAELTIEVEAPADAQRKVSSIAESFGGFVVTSESQIKQLGDAKQELEVKLVVRVPASQFGPGFDFADLSAVVNRTLRFASRQKD